MRAPMTVLLTGASGDVGREIHRVLKGKGVNVVRISSKDREGWVKWDLNNPAPPNVPKSRCRRLVRRPTPRALARLRQE